MEFIDQFAYLILALAFVLCAFCSASETGIMTLNRYKLKHLAKTESYAKRVIRLLSHPERLLGAILIGNTLATAICASIIHSLTEKAWGDIGVLVAPIIATLRGPARLYRAPSFIPVDTNIPTGINAASLEDR